MMEVLEKNASNKSFAGCIENFTESHHNLVVVNSTATASVIILLLAAIFLVIFFKFHRRMLYRLVLYLLLTTLAQQIVFLFKPLSLSIESGHLCPQHIACELSAALSNFLNWSILLLLCWITFHVFVLCVFDKNLSGRKIEISGVIFVVLTSAAFSIPPAIPVHGQMVYGLNYVGCWIGDRVEAGKIEIYVLWYCPMVLGGLFMTSTLLLSIRGLYVKYRQANTRHLKKFYCKAILEVVSFFVVLAIWGAFVVGTTITTVVGRYSTNLAWALQLYLLNSAWVRLPIPLFIFFHPAMLRRIRWHEIKTTARSWLTNEESIYTEFHAGLRTSDPDGCNEQDRLVIRGTQRNVKYNSPLEATLPPPSSSPC